MSAHTNCFLVILKSEPIQIGKSVHSTNLLPHVNNFTIYIFIPQLYATESLPAQISLAVKIGCYLKLDSEFIAYIL